MKPAFVEEEITSCCLNFEKYELHSKVKILQPFKKDASANSNLSKSVHSTLIRAERALAIVFCCFQFVEG